MEPFRLSARPRSSLTGAENTTGFSVGVSGSFRVLQGLEVEAGYRLAGHIHPSVVLYGTARQSMRLPAFVFGLEGAILPAFGDFTGTAAKVSNF